MWGGHVETEKYHLLVDLNLREELDVSVGVKHYKPDPSPALEADAMNRSTSAVSMRKIDKMYKSARSL